MTRSQKAGLGINKNCYQSRSISRAYILHANLGEAQLLSTVVMVKRYPFYGAIKRYRLYIYRHPHRKYVSWTVWAGIDGHPNRPSIDQRTSRVRRLRVSGLRDKRVCRYYDGHGRHQWQAVPSASTAQRSRRSAGYSGPRRD